MAIVQPRASAHVGCLVNAIVDLDALANLEAEATPGPWRVNVPDRKGPDDRPFGEDWVVGAFGAGDDGKIRDVTTDHIHASEMGGGADEDAVFIVALRNAAPALLTELRRLRRIEAAAIAVRKGETEGLIVKLYAALDGKE